MILDATAGNRTMWKTKQADAIVYIDMEKRLQVKPTIFADNTQTPFPDKTFTAVFYDPPHAYGEQRGAGHFYATHPKPIKAPPDKIFYTYWGDDKYKNQLVLIKHIYKAQREFHRILTDDGLLWVKWNECRIKLNRILRIFEDYVELLQLRVDAPTHTTSKYQTFWVCLAKKKRETKQLTLLDA